jgi:hypothetical protein
VADLVTYAHVAWHVEDLEDLTDMPREQAEEWLENNAKYIQEAMVGAGWAAIDTLLGEKGLLTSQLRSSPPSPSP